MKTLLLFILWWLGSFSQETLNIANDVVITTMNESLFVNMVKIPEGTFTMGSSLFYQEEQPPKEVKLTTFWIDKWEVTNDEFRRFVENTGHVTFAEKTPNPEDYPTADPELLVPGSLVFTRPGGPVDLRFYNNWWSWVPGADWRHPQGPASDNTKLGNYPVVQVAYSDALEYCKWLGKSLPTEAQWEYAARGGLEKKTFAWGDEEFVDGKYMANYWQGEFPWKNTKLDGYQGIAPSGSYPPNGYGLYEMIGNVWEWTDDWYGKQKKEEKEGCSCAAVNPRGAKMEESFDELQPEIKIPRKVLKGGSYLCAYNYCFRYRPAARTGEMIDSSTDHIGFRCVVNVE